MSNLCPPTYLVPWYGQKKVWTYFLYFDLPTYSENLDKFGNKFVLNMAFRNLHMPISGLCPKYFLMASIYELNSRITPSTDLLIILKAMFQEDKTILDQKKANNYWKKKYGHSSLTYLPSKNVSKFFFGKKYGVNRPYLRMIWHMS